MDQTPGTNEIWVWSFISLESLFVILFIFGALLRACKNLSFNFFVCVRFEEHDEK
jgi:hypothetical protein